MIGEGLSGNRTERRDSWLAQPGRPHVIAHRGASAHAPENTAPAFERAWEDGARYFEMDLQRSKDGVWHVFHDRDLDRVTDARGPLGARLAQELAGINAAASWGARGGAWPHVPIPSFESICDAFPQARMILEIKEETAEAGRELADFLLARPGLAGRCIVGSFHHPPLAALRDAAPEILTSASSAEVHRFYIASRLRLDRLLPVRFDALQIPHRRGNLVIAHPSLVRAAHRRGLPVQIWTVDDLDEARSLGTIGCDGIITNRPGEILKGLNALR